MTIKNISAKIIGIGSQALMPGEEATNVPESISSSPAIKIMKKKGLLTIVDKANEEREFNEAVMAAAEKIAAEKAAAEKAEVAKAEAEAAKAQAEPPVKKTPEVAKKKTAEEPAKQENAAQ